jgi:flagellin
LNQAVRNSNDGISLAQTAEGALNETTNILQRIRELAVQASNDTNNDSDRASLQAEVSQLKSELDRIAETTNFNGNKVLDGSFLAKDIQVGANVGETLSVSIDAAATKDLARQARYDAHDRVDGAAIAGISIKYKVDAGTYDSATIRGTVAADDGVSTTGNTFSAIAKAAAINDLTATTGVRAIVNANTVGGGQIQAGELNASDYITINDEKIAGFTVQANDADGALTDAINAVSDKTGVVAHLDSDSQLVLTAADGRNIEIAINGGAATESGLTAAVTRSSITLQSNDQYEIVGAGSDAILGHTAGIYGVNSENSVKELDISTREGAVQALDTIDLALENVSSSRAKLGALQNRLESTINNLSTTSENLSASRSRILDADFAQETAQLSRNQIIQQAGVSILAQAIQQPQVALALLG